jgi:peptide/nickel transport system permease protein
MRTTPGTVWFGGGVTAAIVAAAALAPLIAPWPPLEQNLYEGLNAPGFAHPFGQDRLGRDILTRILYGARVSLFVGFTVVTISTVVGSIVGAVAGYYGGRIDNLIMRVTDVFLAFPGILLAIAVMAALGPSLTNVVIALCLMGWTGFARLARGQVLSMREREFVQAARAVGADDRRIILRHILPNILAPLTVEATFGVASAIIAEASLSFLGLGVQPPTPSWGAMLSEGRQFLLVAPHLTTFPGLAIMAAVMGVNFLGDGLRDWMDVKRGDR